MTQRRFPRITENEMFTAGLEYLKYIVISGCIATFGFLFALNSSNEIFSVLCLMSNWLFIIVCVIGLQFKLIADSVAAGMIIVDGTKLQQHSRTNTSHAKSTETIEKANQDNFQQRSKPTVPYDNSKEANDRAHTQPAARKISDDDSKHLRTWREMHKSKLREKIASLSNELDILRPMLEFAIKTGDEKTRDNVGPKLESLVKNLSNVRSELSILEEE